MAVYVDDMYRSVMGTYRGMRMSHMIADTRAELLSMSDQIGLSRRWLQADDQPDEHFDISLSKRQLAVAAGAVEITMRQLVVMVFERDMCVYCGEKRAP